MIVSEAPFGYIPIRRPEPFSALRRLVYEEGMPLFGPNDDPNGCHAQRQIRIQRTVFNTVFSWSQDVPYVFRS